MIVQFLAEMSAELFAPTVSKGEQARQRLLLAALEKIGEKGYDNASVREIADAAGQNVAAIAYYFGGKEKLYAEVIDGIVAYLRGGFNEVIGEARQFLESGKPDPEKATNFLKRILRTLLMEHIQGEQIGKIRNVMMREQAAPTCAFDTLYTQGLQPFHDLLTRILAVVSGEPPESPLAIIRAHTLLSQVIGFAVARCTISRRLGVEKLGLEQADLITAVLNENIDSICAGLTQKQSSKQ